MSLEEQEEIPDIPQDLLIPGFIPFGEFRRLLVNQVAAFASDSIVVFPTALDIARRASKYFGSDSLDVNSALLSSIRPFLDHAPRLYIEAANKYLKHSVGPIKTDKGSSSSSKDRK